MEGIDISTLLLGGVLCVVYGYELAKAKCLAIAAYRSRAVCLHCCIALVHLMNAKAISILLHIGKVCQSIGMKAANFLWGDTIYLRLATQGFCTLL